MKIAIIGLGYVGLPLSALLARNFDVVGFDIDSSRISKLKAGESVLSEPGLDEVLSKSAYSGRLIFTSNPADISEANLKIITVGTPYEEKIEDVNYTFLDSALDILCKHVKKGDVVALKSTVPVGTTSNRVANALRKSGHKVPEDVGVVFSPERIVEGQAMKDYALLPKVIGASDERSYEMFAEAISTLGGKIVKVSNPETAEMIKMTDNYARFAFLGITNELALICEKVGVDVMEMIKAAKDEYPRNSGLLVPGPGVGGSCLNKDPFILKSNLKKKGLALLTVDSAKQINYNLPKHIADLVMDFRPQAKIVAVAGVAFKGDTDDTRFTPAFPIRKELESKGVSVRLTDPFVVTVEGVTKDIYQAANGADAFILVADHSAYKDINLKQLKSVMKESPLIIDARAFIKRADAEALGFEYHGFGRL